MAKGKKTGGRDFVKGNPLAAKGGRGRRLPAEVKEARKHRRGDIELALQKFMSMSREELKSYHKRQDATAFELLILKIIEKGLNTGDHAKLSFLLDNWVGPVTKKIEGDFDINHSSIMRQIESDD